MKSVFAIFAFVVAQPLSAASLQAFSSDPIYDLDGFTLQDKTGNRQLQMTSPKKGSEGLNGEELCIQGTSICLSVVPRPQEVSCKPDSDICDMKPGKAGNDPMVLRVRQNFENNKQVPYQINYAPLNVNLTLDAKVTLWPLVTLPADVKMRGTTPDKIAISVISEQVKPSKSGLIKTRRLHLVELSEMGSHDVRAQELISVPTLIEACDYVISGNQSSDCPLSSGALGTLVLEKENTATTPVYEYFLGGADITVAKMMFDEIKKVKELSELQGKDRLEKDQCYIMRRVTYNALTKRYEFDRPSPDCEYFLEE